MYNEDKKLITEITRKNNMDENLAKFADAVMTADFEYACQKFALNYVVIRELMADKDFAEDPSHTYGSTIALYSINVSYTSSTVRSGFLYRYSSRTFLDAITLLILSFNSSSVSNSSLTWKPIFSIVLKIRSF